MGELLMQLPIVERVRTDSGSHVEPPLGESWSPAEKMAWHAAVVAVDTGLRIHVWEEGDGYQLQVGICSMSTMSWGDAWLYLNGVRVGAEEALRAPSSFPSHPLPESNK